MVQSLTAKSFLTFPSLEHCGIREGHIAKVRVDPFFRDLDQFTILLPVKDLSSVHNPYFLAMKNMITIRSQSFFFKAEN